MKKFFIGVGIIFNVLLIIGVMLLVYAFYVAGHITAAQTADQNDKMMFAQDETFRRNLKLQDDAQQQFERNAKLQDEQEANQVRFEKILSTWERQQQQYQSYLDSLKH